MIADMNTASIRSPFDVLGSYIFQAHRGGSDEVPENTLESMLYAWQFASAIPETDVRTLADGTLVCIHDRTLERTAEAPEQISAKPVNELTIHDIQTADAGIRHGRQFKGFKVPKLGDLLALMQGYPSRRLYLEIKDASIEAIAQMLNDYSTADRIIFIHADEQRCAEIQEYLPGARTMTWCSGSASAIQTRFAALEQTHFHGLTQVQVHLHACESDGVIASALPERFLRDALRCTGELGVDFQVCMKPPSPMVLRWLIDMGVRWFVSDAPLAFTRMIRDALCVTHAVKVLPMQAVVGGQSSEYLH